MVTDIEELEAKAIEAEKRYKELQRIKELRAKIQATKDLEAEVEPGFFKKAKKAMEKTSKGINSFADFLSLDQPKKDKKKKKPKTKIVYKGLKL